MNFKDRVVNLIALLAFFMSFNNILISGVNLSMFIFFTLFFITFSKIQLFRIDNELHVFVIFFGVSAVISSFDVNNPAIDDGFDRAMVVLPNYLYWCVLIIVITNIGGIVDFLERKSLEKISKYLAIGSLITVIFYEFLSGFGISIINDNTPNSYAFMMVCFGAPSVVYVNQHLSKRFAALYLLIILTSLLFLERRAGFILVLSSGLLALNFDSLSSRKIVINIVFIIIVFFAMQLQIIKEFINDASPRIYETIYESENIKTIDQSYLTRVAQIEKSMILFDEHPWTGIGLNNFGKIDVKLPGNFVGAELIIHKQLTNKSAHNSYYSLLAEGGILLILPFLIILTINIFYFFKYFRRRGKLENAYYWSFIAMLGHLYFISELYNIFAWFLISIVSTLSLKYKRNFSSRHLMI